MTETTVADARRRADRLRRVVRGVLGGLAATVTMTVYRAPVFEALPPTAEFLARYVLGGDPDDHTVAAWLLHLGYGAAAGGVFGWLFGVVHSPDRLDRERAGVLGGAVYGLALSAFGSRVLLERLLDVDPDPVEATVFHVGHLVYGLTLGTWVGTAEPAGRDDPTSELAEGASVPVEAS